MTTLVEIIASLVPKTILSRILKDKNRIQKARSEKMTAALLYIKITGITELIEYTKHDDLEQVNVLSHQLNHIFSILINQIIKYNGDVFSLSNDGLVALWELPDQTRQDKKIDLTRLVEHASLCALTLNDHLQQKLADFKSNHELPPIPIELCTAISAGEIRLGHLGGVYDRWELFLSGQALTQVTQQGAKSAPGLVVISGNAWSMLAPRAEARSLAPGWFVLHAVKGEPPKPKENLGMLPISIKEVVEQYVPRVVVQRVASNEPASDEVRRVTLVTIHLPDVGEGTPLEQTQDAMQLLQRTVYRHEGSVYSLYADVGISLIAVFGLPPLIHDNDPVRGVTAALDVAELLTELEFDYRIRIVTGRVFCGVIGNQIRKEYVLLGKLLDLAVVHHVESSAKVICDADTYERTRNYVDYKPSLLLKLGDEQVPTVVYPPMILLAETQVNLNKASIPLVGRQTERKRFHERLQKLLRENMSGVLLIEGESGMGKTRLMEEFIVSAKDQQATVYIGEGLVTTQQTAYSAWGSIFMQRLGLVDLPNQEQCVERIMQQLAVNRKIQELAPLLSDVLPVDIADNELTKQMTGAVRANNTRILLLKLLELASSINPILVIIDDIQYLDSTSWSLIYQASQQVRPMFMVLFSEPVGTSALDAYRKLLLNPATEQLHLNPLNEKQTAKLLCYSLAEYELPAKVARSVHEKTLGHPLYSQEIGYALRDDQQLQIVDHQGSLLLNKLNDDFPKTLKEVIKRRLAQLAKQPLELLRLCGVLGHQFPLNLLRYITPLDHNEVDEYLKQLVGRGFLTVISNRLSVTYGFRHILIYQAVYDCVVLDQRRALHQKVATWYEQNQDKTGVNLNKIALLAYHWRAADKMEKALDYIEKGALSALNNYANIEAKQLIKQAEQLAVNSISDARKAHWSRILGQAEQSLGFYNEATVHLEKSLAYLGWPVVNNTWAVTMALVGQASRQVLHRLFPKSFLGKKHCDLATLETLLSLRALWFNYYFSQDKLQLIYLTLLVINLSEVSKKPLSMLPLGYAAMGTIMATIPWDTQARWYLNKAQQATHQVDHIATTSAVCAGYGTYATGKGQWTTAEAQLRQGMSMAKRLADQRRFEELAAGVANIYQVRGDFRRSIAMYEQVYHSGAKRGDLQTQDWGLVGQARCYYCLKQYDRFAEKLNQARQLTLDRGEELNTSTLLDHWSLMALLAVQQNQLEVAEQAVSKSVRLLVRLGKPIQYTVLPTLSFTSEVVWLLWQTLQDPEKAEQSIIWFDQVLKSVRLYKKVFPIGRPLELYLTARHCLINEGPEQAIKYLRKGIKISEQLAMPYDVAKMCMSLAQLLGDTHPEYLVLKEQAKTVFERYQIEPVII